MINWDAVSGIATCFGVLITAILTFIIIRQTRVLNENQTILEEKINAQQISLQKRQIKADIFPYKREIYLSLFKVMEFSNSLTETILKLNLEEKSAKDIYGIYEVCRDNYLGDIKLIFQILREAEYILPRHISATVLEINKLFDDICSRFIAFNALHLILPDEQLKETKKQNIEKIKENCNIINSKIPFILSIMPNELNISQLDV